MCLSGKLLARFKSSWMYIHLSASVLLGSRAEDHDPSCSGYLKIN